MLTSLHLFRIFSYFLIIICLSVTGCVNLNGKPAAAEGGKKLIAPELEKIVSGNILRMHAYESSARVKFYDNGKLVGKNDIGERTTGRWYINAKDQLCIMYKKWGNGDLICYSVYKVGDEYRQFSSTGLIAGTFTAPATHDAESTLAQEKPDTDTAQKTAAGLESPAPPTAVPAPVPAAVPTVTAQKTQTQTAAKPAAQAALVKKAQNCPGCDLKNAHLTGANLVKAVLPGADLTDANLQNANLKMANMKGATLVNADLTDANLAGADLAGADLTGANLTGTELYGTNLKGATLEGVTGADFMGAIR